MLTLALMLAACGDKSSLVTENVETEFSGGVAADEPRAALVGRDILTQGGSAADAITAMYFALSVTYPMAAGLGGGGYCLTYSPKLNKAEMLDFSSRPARAGGVGTIPGNVRGFAVLQARFGKFRWGSAVAPAEQLALLGAPLSRAAIKAYEALDPDILTEPATARFFRAGELLPEGEVIRQPDLGTTLSALRANGANEFYTGVISRKMLQDAEEIGAKLSPDDLRNYEVEWRPAATVGIGSMTVALPQSPAGEIFQKIWAGAVSSGIRFIASPSYDRAKLPQALAAGYPGDSSAGADMTSFASTGFAAIDKDGLAIACAVTLQRPFGVGRYLGDTGILLGAQVTGSESELPYLSTMVAYNSFNKQGFLAAAATGGPAAPAALMQVAAGAFGDDKVLEQALADPRLMKVGNRSVAEKGFKGAQAEEAKQPLGRVNATYCANGVPRAPESCRAHADPRGHGFGALSGN